LSQLEFYTVSLPDGPKDRGIVLGFKVLQCEACVKPTYNMGVIKKKLGKMEV
jgi:hypothetical protein